MVETQAVETQPDEAAQRPSGRRKDLCHGLHRLCTDCLKNSREFVKSVADFLVNSAGKESPQGVSPPSRLRPQGLSLYPPPNPRRLR